MATTPGGGKRRPTMDERKRVDAERKIYARAKGRRLADRICLVGVLLVLLGFSLPWKGPWEVAVGTFKYEIRTTLGWDLVLLPHGVSLPGMSEIAKHFVVNTTPEAKFTGALPGLSLLFALLILLDRWLRLGKGVSIFYLLFSLAALAFLILETLQLTSRITPHLQLFHGPGFVVAFLGFLALFLGALFRWPNSSPLLTRQFAALKDVAGGSRTIAEVLAMGTTPPAAPAAEPAEPPPSEDQTAEDQKKA
jgi:hypothetical protein